VSGRVSRLVKEPLFHFLILGLAIYAGYAWLNPDEAPESDQTIVVGAGELGWMRTSFEKRWNRPPTTEELEGLTREYVRETAFYREALAMGLDQDDTIVRRRLAQKLEFLVQDLIDVKPATDEELEAYFDEHRADYRQPDLITFTHAFVDPDKWGNQTESHAATVLEGLEQEGARGPVHVAALLPRANRSRDLEALRWWICPERRRPEPRRLAGSRPVGIWGPHGLRARQGNIPRTCVCQRTRPRG